MQASEPVASVASILRSHVYSRRLNARGLKTALERMREELRDATWSGRANCLSTQHVPWHDIDWIHRDTRKPAMAEPVACFPAPLPPTTGPTFDATFSTIARQRRSAVDFDGETHISEQFVFRDA